MMENDWAPDLLIDCDGWDAAAVDDIVHTACVTVFADQEVTDDVTVSFRFTSDQSIRALNERFRKKDYATNVLSWPASDLSAEIDGDRPARPAADITGEIELGDVALGFETCASEANEAGIPFENHVLHLIIHGLLHLFGYDHMRDKDATLMEQAEIRMLEKLGIPNPYERE